MKVKCSIIEDLIPLYKEGLCNEDTKAMVMEHIQECENCRRLCEDMSNISEPKIDIPDESKVFRRVNKKMKRSKLKTVILSIVLLVILGCLGFLTYGQITHETGMISFETVVQSIESRHIAKLIAKGDIDAYADSISCGMNNNNNPYILSNIESIREQDKITLKEAYEKYMKGKEISYVISFGKYEEYLYSGGEDNVFENIIINHARINYKNGSRLDMELVKSYDGKYICINAYDGYDDNDDIEKFGEVVEYVNEPGFPLKGFVKVLFCKYNKEYFEKLPNVDTLLMRNWFVDEEVDNVNKGMMSYYKEKGYTFDNAVISDLIYDKEKKKLYYDIVFEGRDEKGTAIMTAKLYSTPSGLLPPEKEDIRIVKNGCTDELVDSLMNFFG